MANLPVKDGNNNTVEVKARGTGTTPDPYVVLQEVQDALTPTSLNVTLSAATLSAAFALSGKINAAIIGTVNTGTPTFTLQVSHDGGTNFTDTNITATGSTSARSFWYSDTLSKIAGFTGQSGTLFRIKSSAAITATIQFFTRN